MGSQEPEVHAKSYCLQDQEENVLTDDAFRQTQEERTPLMCWDFVEGYNFLPSHFSPDHPTVLSIV